MRTLLIVTLTLFLSFRTIAQDNVDLRELVGFACYYEGRSTKTVDKVAKLLKTKKYNEISKLLTSKNSGEKYLAIVSLQRLADNGRYNLNNHERDLIEKAKLSDDKVSVCSGCTYFDKVSMKSILTQGDVIGSSYWLDRIIKEKKKNAP